ILILLTETKIRTITMLLAMYLLSMLIGPPRRSRLNTEELQQGTKKTSIGDAVRSAFLRLSDQNVAKLTSAMEEATLGARGYFRDDSQFLELFEDELNQLHSREISVDRLLRDVRLLIPPAASVNLPGTCVDKNVLPDAKLDPIHSLDDLRTYMHGHIYRLPQSEMEHSRRAVAVFLAVYTFVESRFQPFIWPPIANGSPHPIKFTLAPIRNLRGFSSNPSMDLLNHYKVNDTLDLSECSIYFYHVPFVEDNREVNNCTISYAKG
ncbi:Protein CL16A, partial [Cichlidogyrus casuarinus]